MLLFHDLEQSPEPQEMEKCQRFFGKIWRDIIERGQSNLVGSVQGEQMGFPER
jgi:hypothetical protein